MRQPVPALRQRMPRPGHPSGRPHQSRTNASSACTARCCTTTTRSARCMIQRRLKREKFAAMAQPAMLPPRHQDLGSRRAKRTADPDSRRRVHRAPRLEPVFWRTDHERHDEDEKPASAVAACWEGPRSPRRGDIGRRRIPRIRCGRRAPRPRRRAARSSRAISTNITPSTAAARRAKCASSACRRCANSCASRCSTAAARRAGD